MSLRRQHAAQLRVPVCRADLRYPLTPTRRLLNLKHGYQIGAASGIRWIIHELAWKRCGPPRFWRVRELLARGERALFDVRP